MDADSALLIQLDVDDATESAETADYLRPAAKHGSRFGDRENVASYWLHDGSPACAILSASRTRR